MAQPIQGRTSELLTLKEAERWTKRRVSTWRRDIRSRKVPSVKLGRQVLIPREAIARMIADGWRDAVPDGAGRVGQLTEQSA